MMLVLRHIPGLFIASTQTFGGQASFFDPKWCINKYGLPDRIASSKAAQTMMIVSSARTSALGIAMFVFHYQQKYEVVDMLLIILGAYVGLVDGYVAWNEGIPKRGVFRFTAGLLIAAWGWFGMHAGR
jgi:Domain of unknown function (DUF4267)